MDHSDQCILLQINPDFEIDKSSFADALIFDIICPGTETEFLFLGISYEKGKLYYDI